MQHLQFKCLPKIQDKEYRHEARHQEERAPAERALDAALEEVAVEVADIGRVDKNLVGLDLGAQLFLESAEGRHRAALYSTWVASLQYVGDGEYPEYEAQKRKQQKREVKR